MTTPTDTPRTDAESDFNYFSDSPRVNSLLQELKKPCDGDRMDMTSLARQLERELASVKADNFDLANALSQAEAELMQLRKGCCYVCEPVGEMNQKLEDEVERLTKALAFIANDNATHDSTSYYRSVAHAALATTPPTKCK